MTTETEKEVATLLAAARRGLSPTLADQTRVRRLTEAALRAGAGASPASAAAPAPAGSGAPRAWSRLGRLAAVGAVAAAAAGVGYRAGWRAGRIDLAAPGVVPGVLDAAPAAPRSGPPPSVPGASLPPAPEAAPSSAPPSERSSSRASGRRHGPPVAAPPATASLAEEVRVLRAVERALRDGNPGFALALLRELDRAVPNGALTEERQAMDAIARCAHGDVPFDVSLARDFTERYPASVYGRRVEESCAATDSAASGDQPSRRRSP